MFSSQGCQCVINVLKELADWACVQTLCPLAVTSQQPCDPVKEMLFIIPLPHSKEIGGKEVSWPSCTVNEMEGPEFDLSSDYLTYSLHCLPQINRPQPRVMPIIQTEPRLLGLSQCRARS